MDKLVKLVKKMEGVTLGIGITDEKIKDAISKNDNIKTCYLLESSSSGFGIKKRFNFNDKLKTVNIKRIRKIFKKKRIENLICDYSVISPFLKSFVKDSVYINKGNLYIYGDKTDLDFLVSKYKRYTDNIEISYEKDKFLLIVNNSNTVSKKSLDIWYWLVDTFEFFVDFLTKFLAG